MNGVSPFNYKETYEILRELSLLIVDSDLNTLYSLNIFLSQYFKEIYKTENFRSAIDIIKENNPDILITDYSLSELNGTELISMAKSINPEIATILFTGDTNLSAIHIVNSGVDRFLKKPSSSKQILEAIEYSVNKILMKKILLDRSNKELEIMKLKEKYHISQEEETYKKQLNIIINDLSNSTNSNLLDNKKDFFYLKNIYKPFGILSGDCYSVRKITDDRFFIFLIDVMGKGLSASVTAITSTTYLNHIINQEIEVLSYLNLSNINIVKNYNVVHVPMYKFINKFLKFIKPVLLDDEILCGIFLYLDFAYDYLSVVNFGMPPMLIYTGSGVREINANELPITKYTENFEFLNFNISKIDRLLICSDGIVEAKTSDGMPYLKKITNDFKNSETLKELEQKISKRIAIIPDDSTLIFLRKFNIKGAFQWEFSIESRLKDINLFLYRFKERLNRSRLVDNIKGNIISLLNELIMNAHEHGNLNIDNAIKERFISKDLYDDFVNEKENDISKYIKLKFVLSFSRKELYIVVSDEGKGFEKQQIENREGVFFSKIGINIIKILSKDFFYNGKGNEIAIIIDIKNCITRKNSNYIL